MNSNYPVTAESLLNCGLDAESAGNLALAVTESWVESDLISTWRTISQDVLKTGHPFEVHRFLFETVFRDWPQENGPPPAWSPTPADIENTNACGVMQELGLQSYEEFHAWSVENRAAYWAMVIDLLGIRLRGYTDVLDDSEDVECPRWLPGAELNIVESCFLAPVDSPAIIYQSENGPLKVMTVGELQELTNRIANGLVEQGFKPGDAIAIDMPMTAEAVAIYLGIIKAGCAAISIADSFTPNEIAARLRIGNAKGIFTGDVIQRDGKRLPLYQKIVDADAPRAIVLRATPAGEDTIGDTISLRHADLWWNDFLGDETHFESVLRQPGDTINILFSSGTSGDPKAIPWNQTTPLKCAADGHFHQDIHPSDVVAWPTNMGWMMGPWLVFAALINRATIALYEGAPTGRAFGQFVQNAEVTVLGLVPSLVQAWRRTNCMNGLDWSELKLFSSTGEVSNAEDMLFCMSLAGYRPVIEYCGGTEIGGGYITGTLVKPVVPGAFNTLALGLDAVILNESGHICDSGELFLIPPSIGLSTTLLNKDHHENYFADVPNGPNGVMLRQHGDQMERLPNDYYRAQGRVDDTMNLGGIKVSSAEIERVLNQLPVVSECAAIAVSPVGGGPSQLVVYVVSPEPGQEERDSLLPVLQNALKSQLNPLFRIHDAVLVGKLPRTATNKILRRELRDEYSQSRLRS